jgi:hypothetical protein
MRGIIFGTLLLVLSLGLIVTFVMGATVNLLGEAGAVPVLIGGVICFAVRHTPHIRLA